MSSLFYKNFGGFLGFFLIVRKWFDIYINLWPDGQKPLVLKGFYHLAKVLVSKGNWAVLLHTQEVVDYQCFLGEGNLSND